jgi:hypothetical protein
MRDTGGPASATFRVTAARLARIASGTVYTRFGLRDRLAK